MNSSTRPVSVLFVEDEIMLRQVFQRHFGRDGYRTQCAGNLQEARQMLVGSSFDIGFFDYCLPDGNGTELVRWALDNDRVDRAYCMTGYANCRNTVEILQAGCIDVLEKPFEWKRVASIVERVADRATESGFDGWRRRYAPELLGSDERLLNALQTVRSVADTDCTVLISGESGTGKELVARAVHKASKRYEHPFVALNCAAIPESMVEAELFGHARGAFTGAVASRCGRVAAANGGTLFLDEVGDMPLAAQAKLLRMLQDKTITPVGADIAIPIDVRIVAATNRNLEDMVANGTFRGDLYYRLSVIPIELPALRERAEDVELLANRFLKQANERNGRKVTQINSSAIRALRSHHWPGNVRELSHLIERTVLLKGEGIIAKQDLGLRSVGSGGRHPVASAESSLDLREAISKVERQLIHRALERTGGNRTEAAALLGLNRTTLVEKIRKHAS